MIHSLIAPLVFLGAHPWFTASYAVLVPTAGTVWFLAVRESLRNGRKAGR